LADWWALLDWGEGAGLETGHYMGRLAGLNPGAYMGRVAGAEPGAYLVCSRG
jgi:hypothetical protein